MASFTDSPQLALTPYIPKVDINTYARVGMVKQQQYDTGLQRVQETLGQTQSLDIANPYAKQYFDQRFNELQSNIQRYVGSDFSDGAIVNRITSMSAQLAKDPRIDSAVNSTRAIRQLQASQNERKSKGEYAPQAEWWDNSFVQSYLQAPDTDENGVIKTYNGPKQASVYRNHQKELNDYLSKIKPRVTYTTDPNSGALVQSVDKTTMLSPMDVAKATQAFYESHPEYIQSVMMDAEYKFQNMTPDQLRRSTVYRDAITQISTQYDRAIETAKAVINANPNNLKLVEQYQQYITENQQLKEQAIGSMQNADPATLKYTLYNTLVQNTAILGYQQDVEHDIKTYETALGKNYLEFLKAGLNPQTGLPLKPNDPLYEASLVVRKSTKSGDGGGDEGSGAPGILDLTTNVGGEAEDSYTVESLKTKKSNLENQLANQSNILRQNIKGVNGNPLTETEFATYLENQEKLLQEGGQVDKNYLFWRNQTQSIRLSLGLINQELVQSEDEAKALYPKYNQLQGALENKLNNIEGTVVIAQGRSYYPGQPNINAPFIQKPANEIARDILNGEATLQVDKAPLGRIKLSYPDGSGVEVEKVRGGTLRQIADALGEHRKEHENLTKAIKTEQDKILKARGLSQAPQMNIVGGKEQDVKALTTLATTAIRNASPKSQDTRTNEQIEVKGVYQDPVTGQQMIAYLDKEDENKWKAVPYTGTETIVPKMDPYAGLVQSIQQSANKMTPTTGTGVLTDRQGKIMYAIKYNTLYNRYTLNLVKNGKPIEILADFPEQMATHPKELIDAVEKYSNMVNPYLVTQGIQRPMTRDELYQYLTSTPEEFNKYMQEKTNGQ